MIGVYRRALDNERLARIPAFFLAACVGIVLGLALIDLVLAAVLMARAIKETTP